MDISGLFGSVAAALVLMLLVTLTIRRIYVVDQLLRSFGNSAGERTRTETTVGALLALFVALTFLIFTLRDWLGVATKLEFAGTILAFVVVLLVLVMVHELGHFITAKLSGVTVQEFGLGYPPRLFAIRFKDTDYSLNLLPLGGFVKLLGEEDPHETGSFASKPTGTRLFILGAGPLMNALLPMVLVSTSLMLPRQAIVGDVVIREVVADSPAAMAGLQPGDVIVAINDRPITNTRDVGYNIQLNLGSIMEMQLRRGSETKTVRVAPRWSPPEGQGATGIVISMPGFQEKTVTASLPEALSSAFRTSFDMLTLFKNGIYSSFSSSAGPAVTGPIGIAQATGEVAKGGVPPLLEWAAFLSMNLAILNILPIPMLDGGRMFFVLLEWVRRGRRVPPDKEGLVHLVGFAVLMGLIVLVSINDIIRIINGESIIR